MAQPELDRLIINNLADLDAAAKYVEDKLVPSVDSALGKLLEVFIREAKWAGEPNNVKSTWMAPEDWRKRVDHVGNDFECHFVIDLRSKTGAEYDRFWLTQLLGIGFQNLGLRWKRNDVMNKKRWKIAVGQQQDIIARLQARRFEYEQADASFFLPVRVDQGALAQAVADESPELALAPYNDALQTCVDAKPDFDALLAATKRLDTPEIGAVKNDL
jgi:hypothetical protein